MTDNKETWEDDFDSKFKKYVNVNNWGISSAELDLKSFIASQRKQAALEREEEILANISNMVKVVKKIPETYLDPRKPREYNSAIDDFVDAIRAAITKDSPNDV